MTLTNDIPPPESLPESVVDDITLLPSNERLIERIDNIQKANEKSKPKLSACGKRLIDDTNQLLETTKHIVENKNNNEQIQKAFFHALRAGETQTITNRRSELKKLWSDMNEEETKQEALAGIGNVITIVRLIFTSKQFRLFFNQASTLVQETLKQKEDNTRALHATTSQNAFPEYPSIVLAQPENETTDLDQDKEEVEQELLDNWVTLLQTLHRHPEYRNSISFLRRSFSELSDYLAQQKEAVEEIAHQETRKASNNQALEHSAKAWQEAKSFIENWVGNSYSLDRLLHAVNNIIQITKSDDAIRDYFGEISKLLEHTVADPDYALNASRVETDARQLISRGRKLFHQKYDRQIAEFQKQFSYLNEAIQHDEDIQRLQEELGALFDDLLKDDKGVPTFHPELIHDLQILTPSLIGSLKSLHIPPLDFSDDDVDLKLEGAILDCSDVTPNAFKFTIRGDADGDKVSSHVDLQISKIRARIHDVKFYYRKKTGFPKYEDSGVADLMIHGNEGMTIDLSLVSNFETTGDHVDSIFTIEQCQCKISKLNLHLHKTSHDVLYTMMAPLMNMTIKSRIERYIENSITTIVKRGDKYLKTAVNDGRQAVENATERINEKVDEKINILLGGNSNPNNQIVNNKDDTPVIVGTNIASDDSINNRSLHTVI